MDERTDRTPSRGGVHSQAMSLLPGLEEFHRFPELPESVRRQIWQVAASVIRTVGTWEQDHIRSTKDTKFTPMMFSTSRPPAILCTNQESRRVSLSIYVRLENILQLETPKNRPIYVNPDCDIIYRGKRACKVGDAFHFRTKDWRKDLPDTQPSAATKCLAVDAMALVERPRDKVAGAGYHEVYGRLPDYKKAEFTEEYQETLRKVLRDVLTPVEQITECALKGLQSLLVVVGNDDDLSELLLVPYQIPEEKNYQYLSQREIITILNTKKLRKDLAKHWKQMAKEQNARFLAAKPPMLTITLMTPVRKPLKTFTLFPKLPVEIQDMIWSTAYNDPRLHTLTHEITTDNSFVGLCHQPALSQVCRASRKWFIPKGLCFYVPDSDSMRFYNPAAGDVIQLDLMAAGGDIKNAYTSISPCAITKLGLKFPQCMASDFTAADAKCFVNTEEIVILLGDNKAHCESQIEYLDEKMLEYAEQLGLKSQRTARRYMRELRDNLEKKSKTWKAYQRRRSKQGKSSPDWVVPTVRLAMIRNISETVSPYSYANKDKAIGYRHLQPGVDEPIDWAWADRQRREGRIELEELRRELAQRRLERQ